MTRYTINAVLLITFALWLMVFGVTSSHALTLSETQKLLATDGTAENRFGQSISIDANTAVIGASDARNSGPGSAYIFTRDGTGRWQEQQKLQASDGDVGDLFGQSVSIAGDTVMIGSLADNGSTGSVYVFVDDGTGRWNEQQKLMASDGDMSDLFGRSISIFGDTAIIGAFGDDDNGYDYGSAYVFERDSTGLWHEQQKLFASDGVDEASFGSAVSISGDTALIGAYLDIFNGSQNGAAYVFVRDSAGIWRERQKLTASDAAEIGRFGLSLSISADTVLIGADQVGDNGFASGTAYVFARDAAGVWHEQQKLNASDADERDRFGIAVSLYGDTALIGAYQDEDNGNISGSAYVFNRDSTGSWHEQQKLLAGDGTEGDVFGNSVLISGDTVMIGAYGDDDNGSYSGSVYVFEVSKLNIEKLINYQVRQTSATAAQLLTGSRYQVDYRVNNDGPNRIYQIRVFEDGQFVCNLFALDPGESTQGCTRNENVLEGVRNVPATVTAMVSGTSQTRVGQTNAYYTGLSNMPGRLKVTHYVNDKNADTPANNVAINSNQAEVLYRVENTGGIELYRIKTYHDPVSPINSGWQEQCLIGTLLPGEVRYCKRTINLAQAGLNKIFGRAQGLNANVSATGFVNAANPTYMNVILP